MDLPPEYFRSKSRTEKELEPIAIRVAENDALRQRFCAACGSENRDLAREVTLAITRYAQELDPTITFDEGTTIGMILANEEHRASGGLQLLQHAHSDALRRDGTRPRS